MVEARLRGGGAVTVPCLHPLTHFYHTSAQTDETRVTHAATGVSHIFSVQLHSLLHSQAFLSMKQIK